MEACPPLFYQKGQGLRWGLPHRILQSLWRTRWPLSLQTRGVRRRGGLDHFGRAESAHGWGDASLSTVGTEVAVDASDGLPPMVGGTPPSPLPLRWWPQ
jgi:hypothetical protein